MVKFLQFLSRNRIISSVIMILLGSIGVCVFLILLPEGESVYSYPLIIAAAFFAVIMLCGMAFTAGGIKIFIYACYYLFFIWLGVAIGVLMRMLFEGQTGYYSAVAVIPIILLNSKLRTLISEVAQDTEDGATKEVQEISLKIYTAAAQDFAQAEGLTTMPAVYRAHTEDEILSVYNLSAYNARDVLMTRLLTVKAKLADNSARTSAVTDRIRKIKNSFFAGFRIDGQKGELITYTYYTPALAASVYKSVCRAAKAYDKNATVESVPDADWTACKALTPDEKFVLSDFNDIICISAENEHMLDKESTLYFNIVLFSTENVRSYADEAKTRGYTPYGAYAQEDGFVLLLTRVMTVNRDSLDACTDTLSDMASKMSGRVGSYGYNFNDEMKKEAAELENIL